MPNRVVVQPERGEDFVDVDGLEEKATRNVGRVLLRLGLEPEDLPGVSASPTFAGVLAGIGCEVRSPARKAQFCGRQ